MTNKQLLKRCIATVGNAGALKTALAVVLLGALWFTYDWYHEKSEKYDRFVSLRKELVHDHVIQIYLSACKANASHVLNQHRPKSAIRTLPEYYEYCRFESGVWALTQGSVSSSELSFVQYVMGNERAIPQNIDEIKEIARQNAATIFRSE